MSNGPIIKTYTPATHTFFEEVSVLLVSLASFNTTITVYRNQGRTTIPLDRDYMMVLSGRVHVYQWRVNDFMPSVQNDIWPTVLQFECLPSQPIYNADPSIVTFRASSASHMVYGQIGSAFLSFYERSKALVEQRFGADQKSWPSNWQFARAVRNAIAHNGCVEIRNANAPPVTWRGVTLTFSDNGKKLFNEKEFIGPADIFLLMEDLDVDIK